jgi:hypothetical protein
MGMDTKDDKIQMSRNLSIKSLQKGNYYSNESSPLRLLSKMNSGATSGQLIRNNSDLKKRQLIVDKNIMQRNINNLNLKQ